MLGSIRLGSVFGIQVRMHWLFAVFMIVFVWMGTLQGWDPLWILLWVSTVFALVFLHELGHSLVARHFGIRVLDITFWPLGGMARMSEIPENSRTEALIAIAGPAVNLVLAFLAVPVVVYSGLAAEAGEISPLLWEVSHRFLGVNLMLGLFNLIPAFPMDGGRLLRAWLGRRGAWVKATASAVRVGRTFAVLMIAAGLFLSLRGANLLPLVGLFVWFSGSQELAVVRARHAASRAGWPSAPFDAPAPAPAPAEGRPHPIRAARGAPGRPGPSWPAPRKAGRRAP